MGLVMIIYNGKGRYNAYKYKKHYNFLHSLKSYFVNLTHR